MWKTLSETPTSKKVRMLFFGDPGVGKTRLAATAHLIESFKPVLFVDVEGGTATLDSKPEFDDMFVERIDTRLPTLRSLKKIEVLYDKVQKEGIKTVVIDTLTELQRMGLRYLSQQPEGWAGYYQPKKVTLPQYGSNLMQTGVLVRAFRDLDVNFITTAHVKRAHLETDGHDYVVPDFTGQQWKEVTAAFDVVLFLYAKAALSIKDEKKGVTYRAITKPYDNIRAKDRVLNLPVGIDLTNKKLEDILNYG